MTAGHHIGGKPSMQAGHGLINRLRVAEWGRLLRQITHRWMLTFEAISIWRKKRMCAPHICAFRMRLRLRRPLKRPMSCRLVMTKMIICQKVAARSYMTLRFTKALLSDSFISTIWRLWLWPARGAGRLDDNGR